MTAKSSKAASVKPAASTEKTFNPSNSSNVLAAFLKGVQHVAVMFVNPHWEANAPYSDDDTWYAVLPLENCYITVRTGLKGFVPKADLRQMAQAFLANPDRAIEYATELPEIKDASLVKQVSLLIPLLG